MDPAYHRFFDRPAETTPHDAPATAESFVECVRADVMQGIGQDVLRRLKSRGERPVDPRFGELTEWFATLEPEGQAHAEYLVKYVLHACVHAVFCLFDGVDTIEQAGPKGAFELYFVRDDVRHRINDPRKEMLHDLLNAVDPE